MVKIDQRVVMVIGRFRVVEKAEGVYRLQYKKRLSFFDRISRKNPWRSISIDFTNLNRLKVKMYAYETKIMSIRHETSKFSSH